MELAFDRSGAGPALVLIHGIGSRRGAWRPVVERLAAEREVIALDLPGFGDSPPLPAAVAPGIDAYLDAVETFLAANGVERPHVAGNSMGGAISLELARRGAVASAAALSPIGFWSPLEQRYGALVLRTSRIIAERAPGAIARLAGSATGRRIAFGFVLAHPQRREASEARLDARALAAAPGFWPTLSRMHAYHFVRGEEIQVPVTIGWGTKDRLTIPRQAQRARALLPHARHVPLPGAGHVPMSDDPEGVAALLLAASATG